MVRIEIVSREDVLDGHTFGPAGPYERIVGVVYFAFDPGDPMNARIVDLALAPRRADGRVEARANFVVLRPKNPIPGGGVALLEVSNRGGADAPARPRRCQRRREPAGGSGAGRLGRRSSDEDSTYRPP
ncbi:MAG: hypothetical protein GTO46_11210 [Gemmatimonadetes bacterium]|nr:hypothetical protein [Gemmatimonadota bacterium]NIO32170.1 hypothetical protein [Gemmatimonadota bacterium]